ncbi:MAG: cytochrome C assembly family protein [Endozoicomonas sp.]
MSVMLASIGAIFFYLTGAFAQGRRIQGREGNRQLVLGVTALGAICQTISLYFSIHTDRGINLGVFTIASLTTLMVTMVVVLSSLKKPAESLFVTILPVTVITVLLAWLAPVEHIFWRPASMMIIHILISVLAYGLLMVAAFQSLLLSYQERQLKHHNQKRIVKALPPLQTMEKLLFEFLVVGVILLTLSLATGFVFIEDMFAKRMIHKTVFSLTSWCLFVTLLVGHWASGWRGQTAMRWTMAGFLLLVVAYFGWRLVVDFVLGS